VQDPMTSAPESIQSECNRWRVSSPDEVVRSSELEWVNVVDRVDEGRMHAKASAYRKEEARDRISYFFACRETSEQGVPPER
jgi:hypothetical protein